jgi:hypothetical protein
MLENRGSPVEFYSLDQGGAFPLHTTFEGVSRDFLRGYRRLVEDGMLPVTVASAMLGATINLYEMFGMEADLPGMLRTMADRLEHGGQLS